MQTAARPQLVAPRQAETIEMVRNAVGTFDADAYHVMNERDNQLVADEILNGAGSSAFIYNFEVAGAKVVGISVVGARHLAAHYKGLQHRLVASMEKRGRIITATSFPTAEHPYQMSVMPVDELAEDDDFYAAVVEIKDLKTGNTIQVERRELRHERRRDGSTYERPNYATIAQSKAYRNGVLAIIPQDVAIRWRDEMVKLGKGVAITDSVLDQKRQGVMRYAAANSVPIDRRRVEALTLDQIAGLSDAAREGRLPAFSQAAQALNLLAQLRPIPEAEPVETGPQTAEAPRRGRGRPRRDAGAESSPPGDPGPSEPPPPAGEAGMRPAGAAEASETQPQPQPSTGRRLSFE